ncbi:AMP-binding protein [Arcanobacterium hippocoleae]|nr:AMP-binding protein [Arcanobacterium hippocoleae]
MMARAHAHYSPGVPTSIKEVDLTLGEIFARAVHDFPQHIAIDFLGREYTYAEVFSEIKRAATALTMCGVRKGDVVSIILPNCPQHYIAVYAITALGAIASEHNPLAPAAQLNEQIDRVGSTVVIAWEQTIERITTGDSLRGRTYLAVNLTKALPKKSQFLLKLPVKAARAQRAKLRGKVPPGVHSWDNQVSHATPMNLNSVDHGTADDIAILIQTGGTTGIPKSVALTHRNLTSNSTQVKAWLQEFRQGAETVAAVLPFFHAFGFELSLVVCVDFAATQVMSPTFDVDIILAGHKRHPITFFAGVPPMFERILAAVKKRGGIDLSSMRYSCSGAMPLDPNLAAAWEEATGGYLVEGYGMSEASPLIAASPLSAARRPSTLGLPIPSTEVKVVNPDNPNQELAEGEVGEILVRGPQVFPGYYENETETAAAFHDGWLRTGDLAKWDDGFLVMADRRKEMIINGGFNVYPSEVEKVVREIEGVADVAVIGMPNGTFGESVVAALVLEPGANVTLEQVRQWTESRLSHYAMPKSIAILDELPRSQIGKVLRRSVKEQLENFELVSGQWRKKLGAASNSAAQTFEAYLQALKEKTNSTAEEWRAWSESNAPQLERFRNWWNSERNSQSADSSIDDKAHTEGISVEGFVNWVKANSPLKHGEINPDHTHPKAEVHFDHSATELSQTDAKKEEQQRK